MTHRFGGYNGVAREAGKWCAAFDELGWSVTRAGGLFVDTAPGDVVVRGMWADRPGGDPPPVDHDSIRRMCDTHDLVVLDNAGTLFSAPAASRAWEAHALAAGVPVVARHHDPPWQGAPLRPVTDDAVPLHDPHHLHVAINDRTRADFADRWPHLVDAGALRVVHNRVDADALHGGDRERTRAQRGVGPDDVLVVHPARADGPSKNIPAGVRFARRLAGQLDQQVRYWLTDASHIPASPVAAALAAADPVGVVRGNIPDQADLYAAADLVMLSSTWEGWGLPVVEAAAARRIAVAARYPVLAEIESFGVTTYDLDAVDEVVGLLTRPAALDDVLDANEAAVRKHFDLASLPATLADLATTARELASR
ncbi:MAG: glycosyltransferase [Dehalococcoidia bacterium]